MKPVRPDMKQPSEERERAEDAGLRRSDSASAAVAASSTSVEVTNTTTASGIRMSAIVLNWRLQVGHRAFLDRLGDLDHLRRALVGGEHALHQDEADARWRAGR